jgi:hypothetical protein
MRLAHMYILSCLLLNKIHGCTETSVKSKAYHPPIAEMVVQLASFKMKQNSSKSKKDLLDKGLDLIQAFMDRPGTTLDRATRLAL